MPDPEQKTATEDYWMGHRPTEDGAPAHDLLEIDPEYGEPRYPDDIYDRPEHYTGFRQMLPETMRTLRGCRGNPNAPITIYRAQRTGAGLNTGDWVSLSRAYAQQDLDSYEEKGTRSVEVYQVPAHTVRYAGDDLAEWGYFGPPIPGSRFGARGEARPGMARLGGARRGEESSPSVRVTGGDDGSRRTAALPTGLWWRVHPPTRTFGLEDATSTPMAVSEDGSSVFPFGRSRKGYSCFADPWEVWLYAAAHGWIGAGWVHDDDVIAFSGKKQRNTGVEGEPLAVPDMATVRRMSWAEFERELINTPKPARLSAAVAPGVENASWRQIGRQLAKYADESPVAAHLAQEAGVKTAAADQDYSEHAMICLKPSEALRQVFADMDECTEDPDELHITLYYLGKIGEEAGDLGAKERLCRALYDFVLHAGYRGLTGRVNGLGCFMNEDTNVLIALWDIPGIAEFRASIVRYCQAHGYTLRQDNHGFTPHMSLAYDEDEPFLTLPRLPEGNPEEEIFGSLWMVWGEEWTEITLL